ncbi:MAG TPA: glycosyltransferase [Methylomirabilota bacterium]|nr:glycosyltransferase [Methylomirabilota bacterium]
MPDPLVTIVVAPRERFGVTRRALEAIYANTPPPFALVYVDGGSPARVRRYLEIESRARGFTLVRRDHYLTPNQARNLALPHLRTRYVAFIDNDAVPAPGWLDKLVECAETTGAWIVGPMYFIGEPERQEIHMAAGDARIEERPTGRRFVERHRFAGKRPDEVRAHLRRMPCEQVEFHCMLVRADVFERLGPLDEGLRSMAEHTDLCMLARRAGGEVYFEPDAAVTYITSGRFSLADYGYFFWRWGEAATAASIARFREKWDLPDHEEGMAAAARWATEHRHIPLKPAQDRLGRALGWRWGRWLALAVLPAFERRVNRWWAPPTPPSAAPTDRARPVR